MFFGSDLPLCDEPAVADAGKLCPVECEHGAPRLFSADSTSDGAAPHASSPPRALIGGRSGGGTSRFQDDFEPICALGHGAFGRVVKARHRLDENIYAIKRLFLTDRAGDRDAREERTLREVSMLSQLAHPNVVRYYQAWIETGEGEHEDSDSEWDEDSEDSDDDVFFVPKTPLTAGLGNLQLSDPGHKLGDVWYCPLSDSSKEPQCPFCDSLVSFASVSSSSDQLLSSASRRFLYIQMEFCDFTLQEVIQGNFLQPSISWHYAMEILQGLEYLHSRGIVHRDVKPANIFLSAGRACGNPALGEVDLTTMRVKIGDFGLSKRISALPGTQTPNFGRSSSRFADRPFDTSSIGTFFYVPPHADEQARWTPKSDMYAFGIILFEMFQHFKTGMERIISLRQLRQPRIQFPDDFEAANFEVAILVRRLLQEDPQLRPSASDTLGNCREVLQHGLKRCDSSPAISCGSDLPTAHSDGEANSPPSPPRALLRSVSHQGDRQVSELFEWYDAAPHTAMSADALKESEPWESLDPQQQIAMQHTLIQLLRSRLELKEREVEMLQSILGGSSSTRSLHSHTSSPALTPLQSPSRRPLLSLSLPPVAGSPPDKH
eukprot:m.43340 g.43340  ORF g.43340 m.43340 type:complete len:605 (+) comp6152_c0_seq2:2022-3836(+)